MSTKVNQSAVSNETKKVVSKIINPQTKKSGVKTKTTKVKDLSNLSNDDIILLDLDNMNEQDLIKLTKTNVNNKQTLKEISKKSEKKGLYIYPTEIIGNKAKMRRFREQRRDELKKFIVELNFYIGNDDIKNQKEVVKRFLIHYKKYHSYNDFSVESVKRGNSDNNNFASTKIFIANVKRIKTKYKLK